MRSVQALTKLTLVGSGESTKMWALNQGLDGSQYPCERLFTLQGGIEDGGLNR